MLKVTRDRRKLKVIQLCRYLVLRSLIVKSKEECVNERIVSILSDMFHPED